MTKQKQARNRSSSWIGIGRESQPVHAVQWVHRDMLRANDYNPNWVAPPEMALLRQSILEDGWTQPIVVRRDHEVVDGFHRYTVSADSDVYALTDGYVPVVYLRDDVDDAHQRMSTIRHNRARGSHVVARMATIVADLKDRYNLSDEEIIARVAMEDEEIERLYDVGNMVERGSAESFNKGWIPE